MTKTKEQVIEGIINIIAVVLVIAPIPLAVWGLWAIFSEEDRSLIIIAVLGVYVLLGKLCQDCDYWNYKRKQGQ